MGKYLDSTGLGYLISKMKAAFLPKGNTETVGVDAVPTADSTNLVESGGVYSFVGDPIVSLTVPTPNDGTVIFTHRSGNTTTMDLNHVHLQYANKVTVETAQPVGGMAPNILYSLGTLSGAVTFSFAAPTDLTIRNEYMLDFDSGNTAAVPTWPNTITSWSGNCLKQDGTPDIKASKHYEVSVVGSYGVISEF